MFQCAWPDEGVPLNTIRSISIDLAERMTSIAHKPQRGTRISLRRFEWSSNQMAVRLLKLLSLKAIILILVMGCSRPEPFTLEFPADVNLGKLSIVEDVNCLTCGNGVRELGDATGLHDIRLPAPHWFVSLELPNKASHLLAHLRHPSLSKLGMIDLNDSDVSDSDLAHLASIPLRYIYLENTDITGEGLQYLKADPYWVRVDLTGCHRLDPQYLSQFKGWTRATIVLPYESNDRRRTLAHQIICDGQPEEICGTQIR